MLLARVRRARVAARSPREHLGHRPLLPWATPVLLAGWRPHDAPVPAAQGGAAWGPALGLLPWQMGAPRTGPAALSRFWRELCSPLAPRSETGASAVASAVLSWSSAPWFSLFFKEVSSVPFDPSSFAYQFLPIGKKNARTELHI